MNFEAAIFDLDGTQLNSMDIWEHMDIFLKKQNLTVPGNNVAEICARSFEEEAQYTCAVCRNSKPFRPNGILVGSTASAYINICSCDCIVCLAWF